MQSGKKKINRYTVPYRSYFGLIFRDFDTMIEYMGKVICLPDSEKFDEWIYIIRSCLYSICQIRANSDSHSYTLDNKFILSFYDDYLEYDIKRMDSLMTLGCIHEYEDNINFHNIVKIIEDNKARLTRFLNYIPKILYVGTETRFRKAVERAIDILVGVDSYQEEWEKKMKNKPYLGVFSL